ncbi:MAG: phosphotransferase enzyme family protein [Tranquillimonas sp.]
MTDPVLAAAQAWGEPAAPPRLLARRENAVYELRLRDGRRGALRLHRPGYQSDAAIRSELWLARALAESGFPCPAPIPAAGGGLLVAAPVPSGPRASLVTWIDGRPLSAAPPDGPAADRQLHLLGRRVARLHRQAGALTLPQDFHRPDWSRAGLVGDAPLWGRFWDSPALTAADRRLLLETRDRLRRWLDAASAPRGLIHGDLLPDNVLDGPDGLHLIDFDDCGFGYLPYDLGTALVSHAGGADLPRRAGALLAGYAAGGGTPPDDIAPWILLRALASCGWIGTRADAADPRLAAYAARAVRLAGEWLAAGGARI